MTCWAMRIIWAAHYELIWIHPAFDQDLHSGLRWVYNLIPSVNLDPAKELNQRHRDATASDPWQPDLHLALSRCRCFEFLGVEIQVLDKSADELAQMMKLFEEPSVLAFHGPVMSSALLFSILLDLKGVNCVWKLLDAQVTKATRASACWSCSWFNKVKGGAEVSSHFKR